MPDNTKEELLRDYIVDVLFHGDAHHPDCLRAINMLDSELMESVQHGQMLEAEAVVAYLRHVMRCMEELAGYAGFKDRAETRAVFCKELMAAISSGTHRSKWVRE